jgi:hypothetical protein
MEPLVEKYISQNKIPAMDTSVAIASCPKFEKDGIEYAIASAGVENGRATVTITPPNSLLAKAFIRDIEERNGTYNLQEVHKKWRKLEMGT